jgi:hypothetical protein
MPIAVAERIVPALDDLFVSWRVRATCSARQDE